MERLIKIERSDNSLALTWTSGARHTLSSRTLREQCPCAVCLSKRGDTSHDKPLTPRKKLLAVVSSEIVDSVRLDAVWSVGNYAIGLKWGDGHSDGIYTFDHLAKIAGDTAAQ